MTTQPHPAATVLQRLLAAGLDRHHAERHLRYGRVRVDTVPVTDPTTSVTRDQVVTLRQSPATEVTA